jgi:hypothetical protein
VVFGPGEKLMAVPRASRAVNSVQGMVFDCLSNSLYIKRQYRTNTDGLISSKSVLVFQRIQP